MTSYDNVGFLRVLLFIIIFGILLTSIIFIIDIYGDITIENKNVISNNLLRGSLGLASLSLSVLGYSFSQMKSIKVYAEKKPYIFVANVVYFIILISISITNFSIIYIISSIDVLVILIIVFIYVLFLSLTSVLMVWVERELG